MAVGIELAVEMTVDDDEARQLATALGADVANLGVALTPAAEAALAEYVRMFLGQKVFTRGSDILEYRLFLLIKHVFQNRIPDEQQICDLFQTTATRSRSLVRSVMSKYQYELKSAIQESVAELLRGAEELEDDEDLEVSIFNDNLVEAMNRMLASEDGSLPPVSKKRGTVTTYVIKPSARQELIGILQS